METMHANWNAEKAKEEIKHGGRFGAKRVREAVYRDNIDIFRQWGYTLPDGTFVGLGDRDALLSGTQAYAAALYRSLAHAGKLDEALSNQEAFLHYHPKN